MRFAFIFFLIVLSALPARAETVVELFTSQGCASCPAADRALEKLARDEDVIALSCHVTYWDRRGWKDTLGQEFCNARQYEYRAAFNGRNVYTPQMIVNGRYEGVGSNPLSVYSMMNRAKKDAVAVISPRVEDGRLEMSLPELFAALPREKMIKILLIGFDDRRTESVNGGENSGKNITYVNVATSFEAVGLWDGTAVAVTHMIAGQAPRYAVLLQAPDGAIVGAGVVSP